MRFGNKAYVDWFEKMNVYIMKKLTELIGEKAVEVAVYFQVIYLY